YSEMGIRLFQALGITSIALAFVYFFFPLVIIDQDVFILSLLFLLVFIVGWRIGYIHILNRGIFNENIVLLGSGGLAKDIYTEIIQNIDCGYTVSVMIPDSPEDTYPMDIDPAVNIKTLKSDLLSTARKFGVRKIIVALKEMRGNFPTEALVECRTAGIEVISGSTFYETLSGKVVVTKIPPSWLIFSDGFRKSRLRTVLKRLEDVLLSTVLLILLSPLLLVVSVVIKLDSRGPLFFTQDRVGQYRKEYNMRKFRSMIDNAEKETGPVWAMDNDTRITRVGRVIRKFRIDELPQLWEVLTGKMSLVGPRPERAFFTQDLETRIPFYNQRFNVKPGITGWAQISYDYGATVEDAVEKLNYDLFYIKNMSLMLDFVIILRTVKTVLFGKGAR
ncbi:MAG: TIGR03013 family PEP-CTERM/XrtA system glycosyltransferase, partial [Desulfobacterales bacterium]|nr:TIGR03013 family PEP-CTERM/XrtA system glycosyltransferase [Desulfobacterales bacterium]